MRTSAGAVAALLICGPAFAQPADLVLVNGRIHTLDSKATVAEALAVRGERIVAVGPFARVKPLIAKGTRVVDLHGRAAIPGLIDSHMHAIRAALSFSTEVNWIGTKSVGEALARLREAAKARKPGDWLIVAGGWTPEQFAEKRRPTQAELAESGGDHPVYVQLFYGWAMLNPKGFEALAIKEDKDVPRGSSTAIRVEIPPAASPATRRPSPRSSRACRSRRSTSRSRGRRSSFSS
jgi:predicted amidohydrolase YtcJ